jgi:hypothetical protein
MLCQVRDWPTSEQHKRHPFHRKVCFRICFPPAKFVFYCWHWSCFTYLHVAVRLHGVLPEQWSSFVCTVPVRTSASAASFKAQWLLYVHSVQQKSSGLIFRTSRSGSDVTYSCHHNSRHFTFPIFVHSCRFSFFLSLQSIAPRIY